jgi:hypothetical protein
MINRAQTNTVAVSVVGTAGRLYVKPVEGYYDGLAGTTVYADDANFTASSLKTGTTVFGLTGTYDTEATNPITAATVLAGKIGWVNGAKVTGTMVNYGGAATGWNCSAVVGINNFQGSYCRIYLHPQITGYVDAGTTIAQDIFLDPAWVKYGQKFGSDTNATYQLTGSYDYEGTNPITAAMVLAGKKGWVNGAAVTGTMVDQNGKGWVQCAWTNSNADDGVDLTPPAGYYDGSGSTVLFVRDPNLVPSSIRGDRSLFGVQGSIPIFPSESTNTGTNKAFWPAGSNGNPDPVAWVHSPYGLADGGGAWFGTAEPDLRSENFLEGKSAFNGQFVGTAKSYTSAFCRTVYQATSIGYTSATVIMPAIVQQRVAGGAYRIKISVKAGEGLYKSVVCQYCYSLPATPTTWVNVGPQFATVKNDQYNDFEHVITLPANVLLAVKMYIDVGESQVWCRWFDIGNP